MTRTSTVKLPQFGGHPRRRENAPGVVHVTKEEKNVFG
jgi:hypothetical protein